MIEFIQQVLNGVGLGASYALLAVGLALLLGVGRVGNFAHGDIAMLGGYALQIIVAAGFAYYYASIAAVVFAAIVSWIAYYVVFRYLVLSRNTNVVFVGSMALSVAIESAALLLLDATPRQVASPLAGTPLIMGPFVMSGPRWFSVLVGGGMVLALVAFLRYTDLGRKITAVGENREAAQVIGISPEHALAMTFVVAGLLAGVAAILLVPILGVFPAMGIRLMLKGFAIVIMGGMSSIPGAFAMAMLVGISESLAVGYVASDLGDGAVFLLLIVFLLLRPTGLARLTAQP